MSSASATPAASASASSSAAAVSGTGNAATDQVVGVVLAVLSGLFIGASFVVKKKGLIRATAKSGGVVGENHAYLRSFVWWLGMIMMIVGEICNFVAYAFTSAMIVTPMGALSVVICAILSKFFLAETLTLFGWLGCALCIIGSVIIAINSPEETAASTIAEFKKLFLAPGFLAYAGVLIVASLVLIFYFGARYGKTHMLVYILICSLIGGLSVSSLQGLGSSILTSIRGDNQFKNWFIYILIAFVVVTLLTELNYLNKALELFNAAMVTPTYYVIFTSATLVTSMVLYQGLKASAIEIITIVMGFFVICIGVVVLQLSKVDPNSLGKLDRKSTLLLQAARQTAGADENSSEKEQVMAAEEPGIDAMRGGLGVVGSIYRARRASIISRRSTMRRQQTHAGLPPGAGRPGTGGTGGTSMQMLTTHGAHGLTRYQLSDNPMPADAADKISLHSSIAGRSPSYADIAFEPHSPISSPFLGEDRDGKERSGQSIRFDQGGDTLHYYAEPGSHADPVHERRAPSTEPRSPSVTLVPATIHEASDHSVEQPPYHDPYAPRDTPRSPSSGSGGGRPTVFSAFGHAAPERSASGGSSERERHHHFKLPKLQFGSGERSRERRDRSRDEEQEREERRALVGGGDGDDRHRRSESSAGGRWRDSEDDGGPSSPRMVDSPDSLEMGVRRLE